MDLIYDYITRVLCTKANKALEESEVLKAQADKLLAMAKNYNVKEYQVYIDSASGWTDKPGRAFNIDLSVALAEAEVDFIEMYGASVRTKIKVCALMGDEYPNQQLVELPKELWESFLRSQPNSN